MKQALFIFLGGGMGSVLRFLISRTFNPVAGIPYGTLMVNVLGSLLLGFLLGLGLKQNLLSNNASLLLATGFCGGFTTFSAFAYENQNFLRAGDFLHLALYGFGSLVLGIAAVLVGLYLSKYF